MDFDAAARSASGAAAEPSTSAEMQVGSDAFVPDALDVDHAPPGSRGRGTLGSWSTGRLDDGDTNSVASSLSHR